MTNREVEVFRAVMLAGTASKAADLLGMSQPAISQYLKKIEEHHDIRLFQRLRGRLVPTREAHAFMADVNAYYNGLEVLDHKLQTLKRSVNTNIRFSVHPALGSFYIPRVIERFYKTFPDTRFQFSVSSSMEIYRRVYSGELDFGLVADEIHPVGCHEYTFCQCEGVVASPKGLWSRQLRYVDEELLSSTPVIAMNPEDTTRQQLDRIMLAAHRNLNIRVEALLSTTVCELVSNNVGVGIVHPFSILPYVPEKINIHPFSGNIRYTSRIIFREGHSLSTEITEFFKQMRIQLEIDAKAIEEKIGFGVMSELSSD